MSRDISDDIKRCEEHLSQTEKRGSELVKQLQEGKAEGEERVELLKAISATSTAQARYAETLSKLLPQYYQQQTDAKHGEGHDDPAKRVMGHRALVANVMTDSRSHHIKSYVDRVFVPCPDGHDPELRPSVIKTLHHLVDEEKLWYQTKWTMQGGCVGVEIEFKVLPEAAATLAEAFVALNAVSAELHAPIDPATWHGKPFVCAELLAHSRNSHIAKSSAELGNLWETTSNVTDSFA
jgi:hypothetical protein